MRRDRRGDSRIARFRRLRRRGQVAQVFDNIAKHAGAGTLVPITGFANAVISPAIEFKSEGFILGVGAKMFTIAGPVIVYGTVASVVYGIVLWVMGMI